MNELRNPSNSEYKKRELLGYYGKILTTDFRSKELVNSQKKVVGIFCNFVPLEIIYAFDCIPVRLCAGNYSSLSLGEEVYPRDVCPLVKSSLGFFVSRQWFFKRCDLIILPAPCDAKKKMYETLNAKIQTILLNIPPDNDLEWLNSFIKEIKILVKRLEEFTGTKLKRRRLQEALELVREAQDVFRELHFLKKRIPSPLTGGEYMMIYQAGFYDDIRRWTTTTKKLSQEMDSLENREKKDRIRILLAGAPLIWPNFKLLNIIEELGAQVVVDELCSATRWFYDLVEVDEYSFSGMLEAVSARYLTPSTCPCFLKSENRIERLLSLYKEFSCEGIIYHSLRLCQLHAIESVKIKNILKTNGIPSLQIYTDYSQEDQEQIKTRVEAFLELVRRK